MKWVEGWEDDKKVGMLIGWSGAKGGKLVRRMGGR